MSRELIQVYEQQRLQPGAELLQLLQQTQDYWPVRCYETGSKTVTFRQYVGILQLGRFTIEVLPKIDTGRADAADRAQLFLAELLQHCGWLPAEALPAETTQRPVAGGLLQLFISAFVRAVQSLERHLFRKYRPRPARPEKTVRGRILWTRQSRQHPGLPPGLVQQRHEYSREHEVHQLLAAALQQCRRQVSDEGLSRQIDRLRASWPLHSPVLLQQDDYHQLVPVRYRRHYGPAIDLATALLQSHGAGLTAGRVKAMSLLFDMNALFERFVWRQLQLHRPAGVQLLGQVPRRFWQKRYLRPDMVVRRGRETFILDTKWKRLPHRRPEMDDLRQMYVYQRFFEAAGGVLLYPDPGQLQSYGPFPYAGGQVSEGLPFDCRLLFVPLVKDGRLNTGAGRTIYEML